MLCLKAEVLDEHYPNHNGDNVISDGDGATDGSGFVLPMNLASSFHKYFWRSNRAGRSVSSWGGSPSSPVYDFERDCKEKRIGPVKGSNVSRYKYQLEQDVKRLQKQLQDEIHLRLALKNAIQHSDSSFSSSPCQLPDEAQELLDSVAILEITVSKLEQESTALQYQLSQERNERRLAEYRLKNQPHLPSPMHDKSLASLKDYLTVRRNGDALEGKVADNPTQQLTKEFNEDHIGRFHPNRLSEEMVLCMRNIFIFLSDSSKLSSSECMTSSSPKGHLSSSSSASFSDSPTATCAPKNSSTNILDSEVSGSYCKSDPYKVPGKLDWIESIGIYSTAIEVSWMTVGKKQMEYASGALQKFRLLVEQLAKVNPSYLSCHQKLAFWINVYNALIMHAFLAYGVPGSDMKLFSLMQKAAYNVGGHSFSAADIEYIILKMKAPVYRPQIALVLTLQKFKVTEEQKKFAIDQPEPLLAFALSCGMHSSPAVRIFRPENVHELLQNSLRDYIQASVGINDRNKLLVPKLLYCFAKGIVDDAGLPDWVCQFLTPKQAAFVRDCSSKHKWRLLGNRSFSVLPFDSRFRFLFLS
ncbi:hypothetical protein K2173_016012 [Erythroxylum novogranatense]|uniref:Uncharacterized protein n=1 Tax=Erythroxylum novogranatense TaxID=1862640 RepID=A0AAV8SF09_9ROSI|nr:hypothetical protein K2173_016012 [Erythroxylum novogranatense]